MEEKTKRKKSLPVSEDVYKQVHQYRVEKGIRSTDTAVKEILKEAGLWKNNE